MLATTDATRDVGEATSPSTPAATARPRAVADVHFGAFFREEFVRLVALAESVSGDPSAAEDLAAEAMCRASDRWAKVSTYDNPGAWVRRVTVNLAISRRRRRAVERRFLAGTNRRDLHTLPVERDDTVWAAVAKLPTKQRTAIALLYIDDLPISEIAAVLGTSESTARTHLQRGRERLLELLGPDAELSPQPGRPVRRQPA